MKCKELINILDEKWPFSVALEWDNVGLLVGNQEKEIKKILVCLDVTDEAICEAIEFGADLVLAHHPLIFSSFKKVTFDDFVGKRIIRLIKNDIACVAMHTNFDVTQMAELNQKSLELTDSSVLMVTGNRDGHEEGIGRVGNLPKEMTLLEAAEFVKEKLQLDKVPVYGDLTQSIKKIAVSGGSGKGMSSYVLAAGADLLVTGDIDHHSGIDAVAQGLAIIDAGHYGTESVFIPFMTEELHHLFPDIEVKAVKLEKPFQFV